MNQIKWTVTKNTNTNNNEERKTIHSFFSLFKRAVRTRTYDPLGKTDQTSYYQNDLNSPNMHFFALVSLTARNNKQVSVPCS